MARADGPFQPTPPTAIGEPRLLPQDKGSERWIAIFNFICKDIAKQPPGKVLDIGTHTGFSLVRLRRVSKEVIGIDIDPEKIEAAKARSDIQTYLRDGSIKLRVMDAHKLEGIESGSIRDVALGDVFRSKGEMNVDVILEEVYRVLEPGGKVYITFKGEAYDKFAKEVFSDEETRKLVVGTAGTPKEVRAAIRRHFTQLKWYGQTPNTVEGLRSLLKKLSRRGTSDDPDWSAESLEPKLIRYGDFGNYLFLMAVGEKPDLSRASLSRRERAAIAAKEKLMPGFNVVTEHVVPRRLRSSSGSALGLAVQLTKATTVGWLQRQILTPKGEDAADNPVRAEVIFPALEQLSAKGLFDDKDILQLGITDGVEMSRIGPVMRSAYAIDNRAHKCTMFEEYFNPDPKINPDPRMAAANIPVKTYEGNVEVFLPKYLRSLSKNSKMFNGVAIMHLPAERESLSTKVVYRGSAIERFNARFAEKGVRLIANSLRLLRQGSSPEARVVLIEPATLESEFARDYLYPETGWKLEEVVTEGYGKRVVVLSPR